LVVSAATILPVGTEIEATGNGHIELTAEQIDEAAKRWPELSEAEQHRRMTLSVLAHQRHQQIADPATGRRVFGGPQPGSGRRSKKRAAEAIAELAQGNRQKEVIDALFSGLDQGNSASVRAATAKKIIDIEREERELQLKEDEFDGQSKDELKGMLAKGLVRMISNGELSVQDLMQAASESDKAESEIVDADVVDVGDAPA
jgi:hypothetical protein